MESVKNNSIKEGAKETYIYFEKSDKEWGKMEIFIKFTGSLSLFNLFSAFSFFFFFLMFKVVEILSYIVR